MSGLVAEKLTLRRGGVALLDGISLSLGMQGSVAIVGPNGAGKSMLLKTLAGIEKAERGEVWLNGVEVASLSGMARARAIGYLPQRFEPHWDLLVDNLVQLGFERAGAAPAHGMESIAAEYGLSDLRRRRWSTLSGGEQARVLLAMVMAADPPVLLADEPAASLDIRHRIAVVETMARRGRERLAVVVMHDLDLAFRLFERVIVLERGCIAADGPARELIDAPVLDRVFGVRFQRIDTANGRILHAAP